jgi:arsenate reductase
MITLYGLSNCDSTRLVLKKLKAAHIPFTFVDLKDDKPQADKVHYWAQSIGLEKLLNRKSTTWRNLTAGEQSSATSLSSAIDLISQYPTLIKRPLIEREGEVFCGIKEPELSKFLNQ